MVSRHKKGKNQLLRSFNGRYAGAGVTYDNHNEVESYVNKKVRDVRLANDKTVSDLRKEGFSYEEAKKIHQEHMKSLSGPVKTYHISELENKEEEGK